jgi:hypothetical protein
MRTFVSSIAERASFKRLMDCLDNELQHHRFYTKFLEMGFDPEQFYADSDSDMGNYLTQAVRQPYRNLIDILPDFMTVIAPGGSLDRQSAARFREEFLALNNSTYSQQLERVEEILKEWTAASSYNAIDTVKNLMLCIQPTDNLTWIGFNTSDRPPDAGFFVDQSFVVDEIAP